MGSTLSISTVERCFHQENCSGSPIIYKIRYSFDRIIPYHQLMLIVKSSPIREYFFTCEHYNGYSYILFQACEVCIKPDLIDYFTFEKSGFKKYKWT